MLLLMCKDVPVYNITEEHVIDEDLAPGLLLKWYSHYDWLRYRRSSNDNILARRVIRSVYRDEDFYQATLLNRALSLSDCYWIKDSEESIKFEDVTPYLNEELLYEPDKQSKTTAKPTLHTSGSQQKEWLTPKLLSKKSLRKELDCFQLCWEFDIKVPTLELIDDKIFLVNFTTKDVMFESCILSGEITEENYTTQRVLDIFHEDGFKMLLLDAIAGNQDRSLGSFGFLRNANTGERLGMAPLFGFDRLSPRSRENDVLLNEVLRLCRGNKAYKDIAIEILSMPLSQRVNGYLGDRVNYVRAELDK